MLSHEIEPRNQQEFWVHRLEIKFRRIYKRYRLITLIAYGIWRLSRDWNLSHIRVVQSYVDWIRYQLRFFNWIFGDPSLVIGLNFFKCRKIGWDTFDIQLFNNQVLYFLSLFQFLVWLYRDITLLASYTGSEIHLDYILHFMYLIDTAFDCFALHDILYCIS